MKHYVLVFLGICTLSLGFTSALVLGTPNVPIAKQKYSSLKKGIASKSALSPFSDSVETCPKTSGGFADDSGYKVWCWGDIDLPEYSGKKGMPFSNDELVIDSECSENQISKSGNRLKFRLDPTTPEAGSWCSGEFNFRAEIRTAPWKVKHEIGTEEWLGWSYGFGEDYVIDRYNQWKMFQVHPGPRGLSPQLSLEIIHQKQFKGHGAGELYVVNAGYPTNGSAADYVATGIIPQAGQQLNIVIHVIWGDKTNGLLQVWIDDRCVYDKQVSTVLASHPWGGNAKWGIYKWPWAKELQVQKSRLQGIQSLETFMGPLRMITRMPGDVYFGKNSYKTVVPSNN